MTALDLLGPEPLYVQIAAVIAARITAGVYQPRRAIPSGPALEDEFDVSRDTIRAAMRLLTERRWIRVVPGRGTYVLAEPGEPII